RFSRDWSSDVCSSDLAQDGLLLRLTGIVRDILLAELRGGEETDPLTTLNHTFADGRILKVWHMELEPMARSNDSERGFDHRNFKDRKSTRLNSSHVKI